MYTEEGKHHCHNVGGSGPALWPRKSDSDKVLRSTLCFQCPSWLRCALGTILFSSHKTNVPSDFTWSSNFLLLFLGDLSSLGILCDTCVTALGTQQLSVPGSVSTWIDRCIHEWVGG